MPTPPTPPPNPSSNHQQTMDHISKIKGSGNVTYAEAHDACVHLKTLMISGFVDGNSDDAADFKLLQRYILASEKNRSRFEDFLAPFYGIKAIRSPADTQKVFRKIKNISIPSADDVLSHRQSLRMVAMHQAKAKKLAQQPKAEDIPVSLESLSTPKTSE